MLERIELRNFAIAQHVSAELGDGLTVITGETGAGKSIMMDALALVLGERADSNIVRHGEARAEIEAEFDIRALPKAQKWLTEHDLDDGGLCVLRRIIPADRPSKASINGRSAPATLLRELGEQLVDIHSQHEHQSLLRADTQRELLDRYAGVSNEVRQLATIHDDLSALKTQLARLKHGAQESRDRLELLDFQIQELEAFSPGEQEWTSLAAQHKKIHYLAELNEAVAQALAAIDNDSGQSSGQAASRALLHSSQQRLLAASQFAPELEPAVKLLDEIDILLGETQQALAKVAESAELDPAELREIEARYSAFHELSRKHRVEPAQLFSTLAQLLAEKAALSHPEQEEARLKEVIASKQAEYDQLAAQITRQREPAAAQLSEAITALMQSLAMEGGFFQISLTSDPDTPGGRTGRETISFEVSTNRGMPAQAIGKIASGGELSRISLAIQVVVSDLATVPTLVFDEVDVGVGGKTAATVGTLLRQLAASHQIICITHLPQVAAQGQQHLNVSKGAADSQSVSAEVIPLGEAARVEEIARMVGGEHVTEESLAHAKSLIGSAR